MQAAYLFTGLFYNCMFSESVGGVFPSHHASAGLGGL